MKRHASSARQPNILFLLSDEHSFRCGGWVDDRDREPVDTPNLDRLAANATVFDQTYCQVPLCTPSRICMLTGRDPRGSGGWTNGSVMHEGVPTLPGLLGEAGYATCLVGKMHLGGRQQFAGFQHRPFGDLTGSAGHQPDIRPRQHPDTDPPKPLPGVSMRGRTAEVGVLQTPESLLQEQAVNQETRAWLRDHAAAHPDQPWFCCASYSRPHFPLFAPKRWMDRYWPKGVTPPKVGRTGDTTDHPMTRGMIDGFKCDAIDDDEMMYARAAYFACVSYLDEIVGDLLATLERDGLLDNTVIVYTSDHGELMGEHGLWWKNSWHEGSARVPFMIQTPEHRQSGTASHVHTPVSLADLLPTLCGFAGTDAPEQAQGRDLSPFVATGDQPPQKPVFFSNPFQRWGEDCDNVAVRLGRYKYIRFPGDMPDLMFDLDEDPLEQHNLVGSEDPAVQQTAAQLHDLLKDYWDFDAARAQFAIDQQRKQAVEPLSYRQGANHYLLADGRVIWGDRSIYEPDVLLDDPAQAYVDFPKR